MDHTFTSSGLRLSAHLAEPGASGSTPGLVLCHGFPVRGRESPASGKSFPELADRIAHEMGWTVLTINFRGCGRSEGHFSMRGWQDDIHGAIDHVRSVGTTSVWLAGFGTGAALCIAEAAENPEVAGVAAMATPADFEDWARNPRRLLLHSREVGVVKDEKFPPSFDRWAAEIRNLNPAAAVRELSDRPLLLLHGENDELVPSMDTRILADAHGTAEMHIISGAGHELRHDPRAVAVLLGWLARQQNEAMAR
jgi:putative redox protein